MIETFLIAMEWFYTVLKVIGFTAFLVIVVPIALVMIYAMLVDWR